MWVWAIPITHTGAVPNWNFVNNRVNWTDATDPCPAGWRISTAEQISALVLADCQTSAAWTTFDGVQGRRLPAGGTNADIGTTHIFIPSHGSRSFSDGSYFYYDMGYLWTRTENLGAITPRNHIFMIWDTGSFSTLGQANGGGTHNMGNSIRCVADI